MFFNDFFSLIRILVVGTLSYTFVVLILRVSGKRTLSKMSAFDFIVTVALGSILGSILTSQDIALLDGILAFGLLVFLQFLSTWLSVRSDWFNSLIKSTPKLLYYKGRYDKLAMKKERILKQEILQAVRSQNYVSMENIYAVVLETDGTFSVLENHAEKNIQISSLENINTEK